MKIKKEHLALVGVLLLILGVEMVVVKQVVFNEAVSGFLVDRFGDDPQFALMVGDTEGNLVARRVNVPISGTLGTCVATSGFVLLLSCFLTVKDS